MASQDCAASIYVWEKVLTCELPASHTKGTAEQPMGTPHQSGEQMDSLTGEPFRWWAQTR